MYANLTKKMLIQSHKLYVKLQKKKKKNCGQLCTRLPQTHLIHEVKERKSQPWRRFRYHVLISIDLFWRFYFSDYLLVCVLIEKMHQTLDTCTVFHQISKHLEFCQNNIPLLVLFSTFFSMFGCPAETLSLVFQIVHNKYFIWRKHLKK